MVASCSAVGCTNKYTTGSSIQYFGYPLKNELLLELWLKAVRPRRADFKPTKNTKLCSVHFTKEDYLHRPGIYIPRLKPDAVPTIFPTHQTSSKLKKKRKTTKAKIKQEKNVQNEETLAATSMETDSSSSNKILPILIDHDYHEYTTMQLDSVRSDPLSDEKPAADGKEVFEYVNVYTMCDVATQTVDKLPNFAQMKQQIKILQQKVRRKDAKIQQMKELIKRLRKNGLGLGVTETDMNTLKEVDGVFCEA